MKTEEIDNIIETVVNKSLIKTVRVEDLNNNLYNNMVEMIELYDNDVEELKSLHISDFGTDCFEELAEQFEEECEFFNIYAGI